MIIGSVIIGRFIIEIHSSIALIPLSQYYNWSYLLILQIKRGLLVIAYTCGTPATIHEVCDNTLQQYWTAWLHRLQKYYVETANNDDSRSTHQ